MKVHCSLRLLATVSKAAQLTLARDESRSGPGRDRRRRQCTLCRKREHYRRSWFARAPGASSGSPGRGRAAKFAKRLCSWYVARATAGLGHAIALGTRAATRRLGAGVFAKRRSHSPKAVPKAVAGRGSAALPRLGLSPARVEDGCPANRHPFAGADPSWSRNRDLGGSAAYRLGWSVPPARWTDSETKARLPPRNPAETLASDEAQASPVPKPHAGSVLRQTLRRVPQLAVRVGRAGGLTRARSDSGAEERY